MSVIDKLVNAMKLNGDAQEDEYLDDDDYLDEDEETETVTGITRKSQIIKANDTDEYEDDNKIKKFGSRQNKINAASSVKKASDPDFTICVMHPTDYDDSWQITDKLKAGQIIVLNLTGVDMDLAEKIMDYCYGTCYAIGGNLKSISQYIFVIAPGNGAIIDDVE